MSIASEISRLSGVREDIFTSITNKGVTVPATATFSSCPALIDSITGGGGGSPTDMVNTAFTLVVSLVDIDLLLLLKLKYLSMILYLEIMQQVEIAIIMWFKFQ
jgi:hypothetical protein